MSSAFIHSSVPHLGHHRCGPSKVGCVELPQFGQFTVSVPHSLEVDHPAVQDHDDALALVAQFQAFAPLLHRVPERLTGRHPFPFG